MIKKQNSPREERLINAYKKGFWVYILKVGMLQWGLPFSILMYLFNVGFKFELIGVILWLVVGVILGGFLFGSIMYFYTKKWLVKN
ncbi:MAG: hypothetical protein MUF61_02450 [archaeon]|jgi:hypothetical protein|nr:hypothetical protein [archaeon]